MGRTVDDALVTKEVTVANFIGRAMNFTVLYEE
jgi:hypothetical protein